MAPFKLFRMGQGSASRSTSQENENESEVIATTTNSNKLTNVITSSSAHYLNIDESDQTSENSSLMSLNNDQRALLSSGSTVDQIGYSSPQLSEVPNSPPPSYSEVMKQNQLLALDKENNTIQTTIHANLLVESFYSTTSHGSNNNFTNEMDEFQTNIQQQHQQNVNFTSPVRENFLIDSSECTEECHRGSCNELCTNSEMAGNGDDDVSYEYDERCLENDLSERCSLQHDNQCNEEEYSNGYYAEQNDGGQQMNYTEQQKGPEILYKSSKELYKAVAKQCGITCKMTDTCRCVDCQSKYFECEFDQNDNEKTDGGLGAGTPMFVNEVLHGTACTIL